jgi:hypothetical protein
MEITVFFAGYGEMEGQLWANAQMLTDFTNDEGRAGCQVGKINIDTSDNNRVAKHLVGEIQRAQCPIKIIAEVGAKTSGGKIVSMIKGFTLIGEVKSSPVSSPASRMIEKPNA